MERLTTADIQRMNKWDLVDLLHDLTGEAKRHLRRQPKGELLAAAIQRKQAEQ